MENGNGQVLRALVFDFDGTIAETERDGHRVAYNAAFEELGLSWRWSVETYGGLLVTAGGKERLRLWISREHPERDDASTRRLAAEIHAVKRRHFAPLAERLTLRPGVARLVREARNAGVLLAIATTAAPDGVEAVLAHEPDLMRAFAVVAAGDVVANKKPAPDIYAYALEALDVAPECALAFEDSTIGLRAALAAGIATLVTPSVYTAHETFVGAAAVLSDLGEPTAPATTVAGLAPPRAFVDLAYARALLRL